MSDSIIIVGAGIGGLAIANGLKQLGFNDVVVLEAAADYSEANTGLNLWSFGVKGLVNMGIKLESLCEVGMPNHKMIIKSRKGRVIGEQSMIKLNEMAGYPNIEMHRSRLQQLLGNHFGKDNIRFNQKVTNITTDPQDSPSVTVSCENGQSYSANLVIGADGIWSKVRQFINPNKIQPIEGQYAIRGLAEVSEDFVPMNTHIRTYGKNDIFGIARVSPKEVRWYCSSDEFSDNLLSSSVKHYLLDYLKKWPREVLETINQTPNDHFIVKKIMSFPALDSWKKGRVVLLGDAAHPVEPTLAMGACTAIDDAYTLFNLIQKKSSLDDALTEYNTIRPPIANSIYKSSKEASKFTFKRNRFQEAIRNLLMKTCPEKKMLQMTLARMQGKYL